MSRRASIIVPVFDTEAYLSRCLRSLLAQTQQDFEIVVVDDCSPGDCKSIVEDFQRQRPHIKYVRHPKNLGLLCARFTGAECSVGDYVGYLDSDDVALPHYVESLITAANQTGADTIGSLWRPQESSQFTLQGTQALLKALADGDVNHNVFTKLYKKTLLLSLKDLWALAKTHRLETPEDLILNVFCALQSPTYVNVPLCLIHYDQNRADSLTNSIASEAVRRNVQSRTKAYKLIREAAKGFECYIDTIIERSAAFFYRRTLARCDAADMVWSMAYLRETSEGNLFATLLLKAAMQDRSRLAKEAKRLRRERSALAKAITEIKESISWKVTSPLRQIRQLTQKLSASARKPCKNLGSVSCLISGSLPKTRNRDLSIVVPTIDSERYIDTILRYYRENGINVEVFIDSKTSDSTSSVVRLQYSPHLIHNDAARVGEIIESMSSMVGTRWVLRLDDDELPSQAMLNFVSDAINRNDADAYSFIRHQCAVSRSGTLLRNTAVSAHRHRQWRLYQADKVRYTSKGHTPGFLKDGLRLLDAPVEACMIHLDWAVHSFDERHSKVRRYDAHTSDHGSSWVSYYLFETDPVLSNSFEPLLLPEFDAVARRLAAQLPDFCVEHSVTTEVSDC